MTSDYVESAREELKPLTVEAERLRDLTGVQIVGRPSEISIAAARILDSRLADLWQRLDVRRPAAAGSELFIELTAVMSEIDQKRAWVGSAINFAESTR